MAKRKKKKKGIRYWKKKAWNEFSRYIRLRDALKTTGTQENVRCYTCRKTYPAFGAGCVQAGHFVPGRGNSILFDERGVHAQCYNCNVNLKGNWPEYMRYMLAEYGQEVVDELLHLKNQVKIYTPADLEGLRDKYKQMFEELRGTDARE